MDFSIDMINLKSADSFLIWHKINGYDILTIIDGGYSKDAKTILSHYEKYIHPYVGSSSRVIIINSHPHDDHIGGLPEIVDYFGKRILRCYFNNPAKYLAQEQINTIRSVNEAYKSTVNRLTRITESINKAISFQETLDRNGIIATPLFSDHPHDSSLFKVLGPSESFYRNQLDFFTHKENLKELGSNIIQESVINESVEGFKPCNIVDEKNDTSAENLTSSLIELQDSKGRKYLFSADAGIDSFESAQANGHQIGNYHICQLPHHGSRRNINSNWISKLNPNQFWVSAAGNSKHPRKAVIECIRKNLSKCKVYSTHKGGTKHINSENSLFPERGWSSAEPL